MYSKAIVGWIMATFVAAAAWSQGSPDWERRYDCMLSGETIVIDGVADEFAWQLASEVGVFTRFQHSDSAPRYRTTAKMLWDRDNLYFLVAVEDPDIWSTMREGDRDCLCREETIELFIDPDGDEKHYAEIHFHCLA